jgi:cold shock CspA family protein
MLGMVKWFNVKKGYGFIEKEDNSADIFVHITGIKSDPKILYESDRVEFEEAEGREGRPQAINVVVCNE